jgi:hypothetical protein
MSDFENELSKSVGPWTVEWCCRGDQRGLLHVDTLRHHIERNQQTYMGAFPAENVSSWIIVGITETAVEAHKLADSIQELRSNVLKGNRTIPTNQQEATK